MRVAWARPPSATGERRRRGCGHVPAAAGRGVREAGDDDAGDGGEHAGEEDPGQPGDGAEVAIEQRGDQQACGGGGEVGVVERGKGREGARIEARPEPGQEAGQADASGGDRERRGEAELPDVEEAEPVAGAVGAVDLAEEGVGAAGTGEGGAEFGPDQAVGDGDGGAQHPCPHREAEAGGGDDQGQGDERAHADHLQHVEEHGGAQADAAFEMLPDVAVGLESGDARVHVGSRGTCESMDRSGLGGLYTDGEV